MYEVHKIQLTLALDGLGDGRTFDCKAAEGPLSLSAWLKAYGQKLRERLNSLKSVSKQTEIFVDVDNLLPLGHDALILYVGRKVGHRPKDGECLDIYQAIRTACDAVADEVCNVVDPDWVDPPVIVVEQDDDATAGCVIPTA